MADSADEDLLTLQMSKVQLVSGDNGDLSNLVINVSYLRNDISNNVL